MNFLKNVNARLGCGNERTCVPQQSDVPLVRFVECSLFIFQLVQALRTSADGYDFK